ncbi:MAG: hypothetical protein HKN88_00575 [Gammaproteobacteria bacterium]|nr:hypothetical protein [Gammaproteobacteria bacterium]NNC96545.1 hypothetical protein [Gammaproteobacteria bacterium]NNM12904.1 hypothetical protein [Gammaproteobacteria bacterium]
MQTTLEPATVEFVLHIVCLLAAFGLVASLALAKRYQALLYGLLIAMGAFEIVRSHRNRVRDDFCKILVIHHQWYLQQSLGNRVAVTLNSMATIFGLGYSLRFSDKNQAQDYVHKIWCFSTNQDFIRYCQQIRQHGIPAENR